MVAVGFAPPPFYVHIVVIAGSTACSFFFLYLPLAQSIFFSKDEGCKYTLSTHIMHVLGLK
jgi:hypothetical protein